MKLLSHVGDRLVFLLSDRDHRAWRHLARLSGETRRRQPGISRGPSPSLPPGVKAEFSAAVQDSRTFAGKFLRLLANDSTHMVRGTGGYGLTVTRAEFETLLQALNDIKLGLWEQMGSPDLEKGESPGLNLENLRRLHSIDIVNLLQMQLLQALQE